MQPHRVRVKAGCRFRTHLLNREWLRRSNRAAPALRVAVLWSCGGVTRRSKIQPIFSLLAPCRGTKFLATQPLPIQERSSTVASAPWGAISIFKLEIGARGGTCTLTGDVLDVVSLRWTTRAIQMQNRPAGGLKKIFCNPHFSLCIKSEPPAGAAPAGFLYKRNLQAAEWRRNGRSPRCGPGRGGRMKPA